MENADKKKTKTKKPRCAFEGCKKNYHQLPWNFLVVAVNHFVL